jgi:hypothetical protein
MTSAQCAESQYRKRSRNRAGGEENEMEGEIEVFMCLPKTILPNSSDFFA